MPINEDVYSSVDDCITNEPFFKLYSVIMKQLNAWILIALITSLITNPLKTNAQSGCTTCLLGYPDNSHLPQSAVEFNESEVLRAMSPGPTVCGLTSLPTTIKMWYNDEHAMTLGVRRVTVKKSSGITTTDYPVSPYSGTLNNGQCISGNIQFGTQISTGAQSGNDVALPNGNGRPLRPVLYLTDLTVMGSNSRAGDWQQGGTGYNPTSICGSWKAATKFVDSTKNPVAVFVIPDADPPKNNWNLAGAPPPPAGTSNEGYGTLVQWDVAALGLIPGHTYRVQVMVHDGDQNKQGGDAGEMCSTLVVEPSMSIYPDINVTYVNVHVGGNVSTNDVVPSGTTYCTSPTLQSSPSGSHPVISMGNNGVYDFVADVPGQYVYKVCVCSPGQASPCPTTYLTITVLSATTVNNPPVANTDIASTAVNTSVSINTLANDRAGNPGCSLNPSSVTVTIQPRHGTVTVNSTNGNTTYTPAAGYSGMDTLTYRVCDNCSPTSLCATAIQVITVKPGFVGNLTLAADDYVYTPVNTSVSGNAKANDTDPEGNVQTITAQTTTVAGKGTLVLQANGNFTFTPVNGFTGPVNFVYTTTDNGTPAASASATIYVLVSPEAPATNPDFNSTFVNVHVQGDVSTNDRVPAGTTYGTSPSLISAPAGSTAFLVMSSNGTYDFVADMVGLYVYNVPVCTPNGVNPCPPTRLYITVLDANSNSNAPVANPDVAYTNMNTPVTLKSLANDHAGSPNNSLVPSSVTITVNPRHGSATVNTANGDIAYTPAAGYLGRDTLTYRVCDNQAPSKCASADQIITVKDANAANSTEAADDYNIIAMNTVATGNVKTNDTDPQGDVQTVTPQNTTIAGKGVLVLQANGDYQFTPAANFTGPVDFPYTTTDNGTPPASAHATLHILVQPPAGLPDLTPSIFNDGTTLFQESTRDNVIRIFNIGQGSTTAPVIFTIPKMTPAYNITINPNETFEDVFGGMQVRNADWTIVEQATRYVLTSKPGVVIPAGGYADIGVKVTAIGIKNSTGNLSVQIVFGCGGGETPYNNNADNNTYSTN